MPKIPGAQSRVEAGGQIRGGRINPSEVADNPLYDVSRGLGQLAKVQARKEQRQDALWREKAVAKSRAEWAQRMETMQREAEPGAPAFTERVNENFEEWRQEQLDAAPNRRTRQELDADLERLKAGLAGQAIRFEAAEAANLQVTNTQETFDTNANTVRANPGMLGEVIQQNERMVDSLDVLSAKQKRELKTEQQDRMYWAAVNGRISSLENAEDAKLFLEELKSGKDWKTGLQPSTYNSALNAVSRTVDQLEAEDQQQFVSGLGEQVRELKAGVDNGLTPEIVAQNIDDPKQRERWTTEVKHARTIMEDMQTVRSQSATEIRNQLASLQGAVESPGEFDADRERLKSYAAAVKQRQQMLDADPAKYAMEVSPRVQQAMERLQQDSSPAAVQQYVTTMTAEQQRLTGGGPVNLLTQEQVASIAQEFAGIERTPEGAQQAYETVAGYADTWGQHWPTIQRQLQEQDVITGPMAVAANLTGLGDRATGQTLVRALFTGKKEMKNNLDDPAIATDIDRQVNAELEDFQQTLVHQAGGMQQYAAHRDAVSTLALYYADTQGLSAGEAVERATKQVVNGKYAFMGSYRIPRTENVSAVADGARRNVDAFDDSDLVSMVSVTGLSDDFARQQTVDYIRDSGQWVTNADESGLTLAVPDATGELVAVEVTDANGNIVPYSLTWDELAAKSSPEDAEEPLASDRYGPGAVRYNRGQ